MPNKRAIFLNTGVQVLMRVITLGFALISTKLITNHLGTTGTGEYNTISTYIGFFIVIADFGFFSSTVRELAKHPEKEASILANVLTIRTVTALVAALVAAGLIFLTDYSHELKLGIVVSTGFIFFNLLASLFDMVFQTRYKMQYSAVSEGIAKLLTLIVLYFLIKNDASLVELAATFTLTGFLIFILKWAFSRPLIKIRPRYDKDLVLWIFKISTPLGIVFILNNMFFKIDTLILFSIKGADAVGIYSVAYKVLEVTIFVGSYFASSLKPVLARQVHDNPEKVGGTINKGILVMLLISIPISVCSAVFAKEIILLLSSPAFLTGSTALIIISATLPLLYLDILLGEVLIALDARKLLIRISIGMLALNVALNLLLIPRYSFLGAAGVTVACEALLLLINLYYTQKLVGYRLDFGLLGKFVVLTGLTCAAALLLRQIPVYFIFPLIASFAAYVSFSFLLKIVSPAELKELV